MPAKKRAKKRTAPSGRRSKYVGAKVRDEKEFELKSGRKVKYGLGQECGLKKRSKQDVFILHTPTTSHLVSPAGLVPGERDRQQLAIAKAGIKPKRKP